MILIISITNAQKLNYGFIVGTGTSTMYMRNVPDEIEYNSMYAPLLSYNINAFVSYKSTGFWGVSIEPGFIKKGGVQLFDYMNHYFLPQHYKVIVDFNSIELPVLFNMYLNKRLYASIGLEFEYRMSEKATITDKVTWNDQSLYVAKSLGNNVLSDNILPDNNNRFSNSGLIALNYCIDNRFDIGLRYGLGLEKLIQIEWLDNFGSNDGSSDIYNNYLQLILKVKL